MENSEIWKILEGIIDLHRKDVVAHDTENELPSTEMQEALKRFAAGKVQQEERTELCNALRDNPQWVSFLATCVKEQRVG